jgi:phosphatidylglycerophosphate synthase
MSVCVRPSNALSLSRILFLFAHILVSGALSPAANAAIVLANYLLDGLDGMLSRRFGSSDYGEFMDISVDRIVTLGYFAYHLSRGRVSVFFFMLVLARDVMVDYVSYFQLIGAGQKERHKTTKGLHYWVYTSRASKLVNWVLQMAIAAWGFAGPVPAALQALFLLNSYVRGAPSLKKAWNLA